MWGSMYMKKLKFKVGIDKNKTIKREKDNYL